MVYLDRSEMAEVFACLVYVLDGSTVSIDVNVSTVVGKFNMVYSP